MLVNAGISGSLSTTLTLTWLKLEQTLQRNPMVAAPATEQCFFKLMHAPSSSTVA
jgi:hypothetical protein